MVTKNDETAASRRALNRSPGGEARHSECPEHESAGDINQALTSSHSLTSPGAAMVALNHGVIPRTIARERCQV
jgi:hypothetical protein